MNPTLKFLSDVRDGLEHVDYEIIYRSVEDLRDKFIPTAILKKGSFIDRVRINSHAVPFTQKDQISYISDPKILAGIRAFGRANVPGQGVFYGSLITKHIPQPRVAAYFETSDLVKSLNDHDTVEETFTLSRWRVLQDLEVVEMIFSEAALKVNEYVQMSLNNQLKNITAHPQRDHCIAQGTLFSNEFARTDIGKGQDYKYKISAAYANYLWNRTGLMGITYPSVPTEYKGQNVALLPAAVDGYLRLETVGEFKFVGRNNDNMVTLRRYCKDFGIHETSFNWQEYHGDEIGL
ncbi:MAG: hypothetical protein JNN04_12035 [Cyclobacteriaceae bacterium]|nr:hypothetical protein [Cyclobacteriaceae bacterium]